MNYTEMAEIMRNALGSKENPVAVTLFRDGSSIPSNLLEIEKPLRWCEMIQGARLRGETSFAHEPNHSCKGGAAGLGLLEMPENISSGNLYFSKLNKVSSTGSGAKIVSSMPKQPVGTVATLATPLYKATMKPDVVIFVGNPLQARRIVQAALYTDGGRVNMNTAGIQSFCIDATSSPILKGEVNISLGCDGAAKNANLEDSVVVVGIPFDMMEEIAGVLLERAEGWNKWMRP